MRGVEGVGMGMGAGGRVRVLGRGKKVGMEVGMVGREGGNK